MSTDTIEIQARHSAANLTDPLSKAAVLAHLDDTIAYLTGLEGGLHIGAPDGQQVSPSSSATLGTATLGLRFFRDYVAAGGVYTDLIEESDEPERPALVYLTADDYHGGLSHAFSAGYQAGSNDRELVGA